MQNKIVEININGKNIFLLPTAHISKISKQDVIDAVAEINPDTICVELDEQRYQKIIDENKFKETSIEDIIKEKKVNFLLVNLILSSFQRRMAENLDSNSGAEMIEGINQAQNLNKNLILADRSIGITFSRIWSSLNFFSKIKLLYNIVFSLFEDEKLSEEDLQNLQKQDVLEASINEIGKKFPVVKKILVDERDMYLAYKIKNAPGDKIFAVLGAAHLDGVLKNLKINYQIDDLDKKIEKSFISKIIPWIISLVLIGFLVSFIAVNKDLGFNQLKNWFLINGSFCALGILLVKGNILSAITGFLTAPFTILHPLLAAGWFAGLTEAKIIKPQVKDFENLALDTKTLKGFFSNKVTRILLVVVSANLFSMLAGFISSVDLIKNFLSLF